jgi:formylglycine-generating enzyme required for sulfatase activity
LVGSTLKVAIRGAELGPAKSVAIGRDFGIGNFEDTVEQFKAFVEEAEYRPVTLSPGWEAHEEGAPPTSGLYAASDEPSGLRQLEKMRTTSVRTG